MPSIKQSAKVNLKDWQQVPEDAKKGGDRASTAPPPDPFGKSPVMLASMPLMASTGDAFQRQFYNQTGTPQQRILPAKKGGGA